MSRDVALAADETIGLSSVSANRSTPAAQSQADRADANRKTITRYVDGPLDSARQEGRPRATLRHSANQQTNKKTRRPTSTGMQRRALVAHVRVDHDHDALEAALAEQWLDVQPIARVAEAAGITHHATCSSRATCNVPCGPAHVSSKSSCRRRTAARQWRSRAFAHGTTHEAVVGHWQIAGFLTGRRAHARVGGAPASAGGTS